MKWMLAEERRPATQIVTAPFVTPTAASVGIVNKLRKQAGDLSSWRSVRMVNFLYFFIYLFDIDKIVCFLCGMILFGLEKGVQTQKNLQNQYHAALIVTVLHVHHSAIQMKGCAKWAIHQESG